jgi:microcompartment protein CcmK/EutM
VQLGRVIGTDGGDGPRARIDGIKCLSSSRYDKTGRGTGRPVVAADAVAMAGPASWSTWWRRAEAAQALPETFAAVDHAVVGIVDELYLAQEKR